MLSNLRQFNLPEVEEKVLDFWKTNKIFEKSLKKRDGGQKFIFYEGPPYANGKPGIHHVLARVFKDIILRYKTMRGYYVPRRAGWDTHGLPIELEAERQLGIKSKRDIEKLGVALFNKKSRESIWVYKDEWERLTERIGYWLDLKGAYITYENYYIESLWWIFGEIAKKKLLYKDYKVVPYCPRCQTVLASHELGMPGVYKKVKDPSIYVKFKLRTKNKGQRTRKSSSRSSVLGSKSANEYLLVWTTTPWTLPANLAIAVNPKFIYTKYKINGDHIWSLSPPPTSEDHKAEVVEKISGKKLVGISYDPLYPSHKFDTQSSKFYKVYAADFISSEEGTGFVHIAPAFGEDDFNLFKKGFGENSSLQENRSQFPVTVDDDGKMIPGFPGAGKFAKDADKDVVADLEKRKLIFKAGEIEHDYPFCWRCSTVLLYFARTSWFIEMSKLRKQLVAANRKVNWTPAHIKEGRFGEWVKEAKDWAISRERFWGTPLPIWECKDCGEYIVVSSLNELDKRAYHRNHFLLLRHTEAEHNIKDMIASGEQGMKISLTEKGKHDGEALARKLKGKVDIIYSSPYKRALDLAKMIGETSGLEVSVDERLSEGDFGIFNDRLVREHKGFFSSPLEEFTKTPPGGENLTDMKERMFKFLREVNQEHSGKTILIISHGDPLWVLEGATRNFSNEEILTMDYIPTGEIREVSLHNFPYDENGNVDMHRPYVDEVMLRCEKCDGKMLRLKEIADVWFDSGAMPFASVHWPFTDAQTLNSKLETLNKVQSSEKLDFPADFICEAIDQTRGWFYTLLAVATLLGYRKPPYKNVISLGLINDKFGQKMSKSKGNVVDPWEIIRKYGVDAVRWYFYTTNSPGETKNFDEAEVKKSFNKVINILYNSYVFYDTYAPKNLKLGVRNLKLSVLDRWILARLHQTIQKTTAELECYEVGVAAKGIEYLVDDLSRWYIRRSRRRLQRPEDREDYEAASATLGFVILEVSKLIAPFTPFFAEALYRSLSVEHGLFSVRLKKPSSTLQVKDSVHLESWPEAERAAIDANLLVDMEWVRDMTAKALARRAEAGIKVRQPLALLKVRHQKSKIENELLKILGDEVNVKGIYFDSSIEDGVEIDTNITPELREEGVVREFSRLIQELRQEAGLKPKDVIVTYIETRVFADILQRHRREFDKTTGTAVLYFKRTDKFDAEIETRVNDKAIWIGIKKR